MEEANKPNKTARPAKQVERIAYYENLLDRCSAVIRELEGALDAFENIQTDVSELESYYTGRNWKKDLEADENGRLPEGLKRGVLSEDAVYDLLEANAEMHRRLSGEE